MINITNKIVLIVSVMSAAVAVVGWKRSGPDQLTATQIDIVDKSGNLCLRLRGEDGSGIIDVYRLGKDSKTQQAAKLSAGNAGAGLILSGTTWPEQLVINGYDGLTRYNKQGGPSSGIEVGNTIVAKAYDKSGAEVDREVLTHRRWVSENPWKPHAASIP
jgi:hypothetical protein